MRQREVIHLLGKLAHLRRSRLADHLRRLLDRDVLVVLAELRLCRRREEHLRKPLAQLEALGQHVAAHNTALLVVDPARAGNVAADNRLDRHHVELAHEHAPALEQRRVLLARLGHLVHVVGDHVVLALEAARGEVAQPEGGELVEDFALSGHAVLHHDVEGGEAVGDHEEQPLAVDLEDITHLALAELFERRQLAGREQGAGSVVDRKGGGIGGDDFFVGHH